MYSLSQDNDLLGGMWAVLATIFVLRDSFGKSVAAAVSRMSATFVSFVLCLIYLAFLPFHAWALAVLVGASALVVMLLGRPGNAVTAGITTAVIMVVAAVSPQRAWQQPILRLADTIVGVAVGALAASAACRSRGSCRLDPFSRPGQGQGRLSERAMVGGPTYPFAADSGGRGDPYASAQRWPDTDITVRLELEKNFPNERWRLLPENAEARGAAARARPAASPRTTSECAACCRRTPCSDRGLAGRAPAAAAPKILPKKQSDYVSNSSIDSIQ